MAKSLTPQSKHLFEVRDGDSPAERTMKLNEVIRQYDNRIRELETKIGSLSDRFSEVEDIVNG